jgi:hypothetical protein
MLYQKTKFSLQISALKSEYSKQPNQITRFFDTPSRHHHGPKLSLILNYPLIKADDIKTHSDRISNSVYLVEVLRYKEEANEADYVNHLPNNQSKEDWERYLFSNIGY